MSQEVYDPKKPNTIYLRPNPGARPIKYEQAISLQGLMLDRKHSIAMYTSRAGMAMGPPGPTADVYDTIICSGSDLLSPITTGGPKEKFRAPYPLDMSVGYVRANLATAPTGSAFIVDLLMNGVSMFSTPIYIDAGEKTSVTASIQSVIDIPDMLIPDDAEFEIYVDQVGSSFTGAGLKVAVTGRKVPF